MLPDSHVLESLPAYALGSLEQEEARLVAEHIASCYLCRKELAAFQTVADQLSLAAPSALPSAELKPRLMERIQGLDRKRGNLSTGWRFSSRLVSIGAFAGLALILLLAVSNFLLWQQIRNMNALTGPHGMRAIALQNTAQALEASGFVIVGSDGRNGVLVVDKLPVLDPTREYQVWLTRDGSSTSGAVFSVDEDGYRGVRLITPESLLVYTSMQVTIEPAGGSENPTGSQVLTGSLSNQ